MKKGIWNNTVNIYSRPRIAGLQQQPVYWQEMERTQHERHTLFSATLDRVIGAAAVNTDFRQALLTQPVAAIAKGCNGESFPLSKEEEDLLDSICASSLQDFAACLLERLGKTDGMPADFATTQTASLYHQVVHVEEQSYS